MLCIENHKNGLIIFESVEIIKSIKITMMTFYKVICLNKYLYFLNNAPRRFICETLNFLFVIGTYIPYSKITPATYTYVFHSHKIE